MGKYLGIPSEWGRSKREMFSWMLARVQNRVEGWKEHLLSKAGKEVLLKAVVQSIPQYAMTIFKLPKSISQAIEQRIREFWWRNNAQKKGIHWRNWDSLKQRKDKGGLGFRDLADFNDAMLGKQVWRMLQNPLALWSRVFKALYFPNTTLLQAKNKTSASWGWKSLMKGMTAIQPALRWIVGDGAKIKIFEDQWLSRGVLWGPVHWDTPKKVSDLLLLNPLRWNTDKVQSLFDPQISQEIINLPLSEVMKEDNLVWTPTRNGEYTVKSAYNFLQTKQAVNLSASSSYTPPSTLWNRIWSASIPPKVKHFLWQISNNALATKDNLMKRGISPEALCPICGVAPETTEHVLLSCPWTQQIWQSLFIKYRIQTQQVSRMDAWLADLPGTASTFVEVSLTLWQIWKDRNSFVFRGKHPRAVETVHLVNMTKTNFQRWDKRVQGKPQTTPDIPVSGRWDPPPEGSLKFNVDGSFVSPERDGAIACVCRDRAGVLRDGFARTIRAASAAQMEALAVLETLKWVEAKYKGVRAVVETDHFDLWKEISTRADQPDWSCRPFITEAQARLHSCEAISLSFCSRNSNRVTDWVVKAQRTGLLPANWVRYPPSELFELLCLEFYPGCYSSSGL